MFRPNTYCSVSKRNSFDRWGREIYGSPMRVKCSIIRLKTSREKSSVRADSSASRGRARETESESVLLLPPAFKVEIGDRVDILGMTLEVESIAHRLSISGRHDHNEVGLCAWVSKFEE